MLFHMSFPHIYSVSSTYHTYTHTMNVDENEVISITGEQVLLALENGVSQVEAMEGRFPCVDGIRFEFDPRKKPFSRINADSVYVRDCPYKRKGRSKIRGEDMSHRQSRRLSALNSLRELILEVEEEESFLPGYSRLDMNRYYSVVSNVYLTSGKVRNSCQLVLVYSGHVASLIFIQLRLIT